MRRRPRLWSVEREANRPYSIWSDVMLRRLELNIGKYGAIAQINLQNSLAYAGELANRSLFMVLILYVFIQLWRATYGALGAATIAGLSLADTLWYLVM